MKKFQGYFFITFSSLYNEKLIMKTCVNILIFLIFCEFQMHAAIADVAAAKARMFINKPDGSMLLFDLFENIGKPYMHFLVVGPVVVVSDFGFCHFFGW